MYVQVENRTHRGKIIITTYWEEEIESQDCEKKLEIFQLVLKNFYRKKTESSPRHVKCVPAGYISVF